MAFVVLLYIQSFVSFFLKKERLLKEKGKNTVVTPAFFKPIAETECINWGQCAAVWPVGALTVKKNILEVQKNLDDPTKTCVVHMAPAVRVGIGEEFGLPANEETTG